MDMSVKYVIHEERWIQAKIVFDLFDKELVKEVGNEMFLGVAESEYWSLLRGNQGKLRVGNHFHGRSVLRLLSQLYLILFR